MEQVGVSGLFGVFLAGLVLELGLAKPITEKIEDLVLTILVPLYFATSGLKTNLGLLNSGIIWAYVVCVMVVAFCGKFFGCASAAKVSSQLPHIS
jgi:Kef-type K+ transport system membrane component KefB